MTRNRIFHNIKSIKIMKKIITVIGENQNIFEIIIIASFITIQFSTLLISLKSKLPLNVHIL